MFESFLKPPVSFPTFTGSIVTFNAQYALPLKSHKIALTATQSGSGTPSPDNVRNINGVSAINISATGKNLLRINKPRVVTDNGVIFTTNDDMSETISGEFLGVAICRVSILVSLKAGTYILSGCPSGGGYSNYVLRLENSSNVLIALDTGNGATFTTTEDQFVYCRIYIYSQNGVGKTFYPMVRMVNTNSDYEPFGTYNTIQIGSTVYGGEYDARTGVLTVTHKGILARDVSGWAKSGSVFYRNFADVWTAVTPDTPTGRKPLLCSHFDYSSGSIVTDLKVGYGGANNNGNIIIRYDALSTISDFNDYIANNDVFIVYPLATSTTIQLPPCPIDTIANSVNNIWADTGDTTLQYIKIG